MLALRFAGEIVVLWAAHCPHPAPGTNPKGVNGSVQSEPIQALRGDFGLAFGDTSGC